jgi:hypothetical protein
MPCPHPLRKILRRAWINALQARTYCGTGTNGHLNDKGAFLEPIALKRKQADPKKE